MQHQCKKSLHNESESDSMPMNVLPLRVFASNDSASTPEFHCIMINDQVMGQAQEMIACSEILQRTLKKVALMARSKIPVLIQGETGTGKELIARYIHDQSPRREKSLIQVNCAAFSDTLIESDLFGHEKGAFTGAAQQHVGYFERADGSSILLDEVGEMRIQLQAKLLRILEEETFERVGGERLLRVDLRIIATTNRNLEEEVCQKKFRSDLYYRLNTSTINLPPLRERVQEIPALVRCFIRRFGQHGPVQVEAIAPAALTRLMDYDWPGNIRQLRNVIQHACVCASSRKIELNSLPSLSTAHLQSQCANPTQTLAELERERIFEVLREVGGNKTVAAIRLGISTRTLQNKLKLYRESKAA
jgi:transcriptional regulator with PAS, ATPase and Fis domain